MNKWIKTLLAADFFVLMGMGMITPIYALFVDEIGGGILEASISWAVFSFTAGVLMYLIGKWEDRKKNYAKMLFLGYLLRAFAFLGYLFVKTPLELFGVQILLGLSLAIGFPSYDTLYSQSLDRGRFATEWGAWEAMNMIVAAIAALVGGFIASSFGFSTLFIIMFLSGITGTIISASLLLKKQTAQVKLKKL